MSAAQLPGVGDEVAYEPGAVAIVTDIRRGIDYLRAPGRGEWQAEGSDALLVTRTRLERIKDADGR